MSNMASSTSINVWQTFALGFLTYTTHAVPCNNQPGGWGG